MEEFKNLERQLKNAYEQLTKKWNGFNYDEQLEYYYVFTTKESIKMAIHSIEDYIKRLPPWD